MTFFNILLNLITYFTESNHIVLIRIFNLEIKINRLKISGIFRYNRHSKLSQKLENLSFSEANELIILPEIKRINPWKVFQSIDIPTKFTKESDDL